MFKSGKKDNKREEERGTKVAEELSSILSEETTVKGDVFFKGKMRIDGKVEGNVEGDYLILGASGKILGDVKVQTLVCQGSIEGSLSAENVELKPTSFIKGKLEAVKLSVDAGAKVEGEVFVGEGRKILDAIPYVEEGLKEVENA